MHSEDCVAVYAPVHLDPYDSYGLIGCELVRHLSRFGVYVNAVALGSARHPNQDDEVAALVRKPLRPTTGGLLLGYPTNYDYYGALAAHSPRIAVTMFESTKLPQGWVEGLNSCDAVIVPSQFCARTFYDCGVHVPIYRLPLGINPIYRPAERSLDGTFNFLAFMDRGRRKGGLTVLNAFVQEFFSDMGVHLYLKIRREEKKTKLEITNPNIDVIYEDMTPAQLNDLYRSCHCLVNPNLGEGFGLIPREFAATGGISLATAWAGTSEDIQHWGWPIDYRLARADWAGIEKFKGQDLGLWAEVEPARVARLMRHVYAERVYYQSRAYVKSQGLQEFYSWEKFAAGVYGVWRGIVYGDRTTTTAIAA